MNRGSPKIRWTQKEGNSSSSGSSSFSHMRDDQSYSCKPKNGSPSDLSATRGSSSVKNCSVVLTPPNVSYKPFTSGGYAAASSHVENVKLGTPTSVATSSGQFQSPSTCSNSREDFAPLSRNSDIGVSYLSGELDQQKRHPCLVRDKICKYSELANSDNKKDLASQERRDISGNRASFDICTVKSASVKLNAPLHLKNREKRHENKRISEGPNIEVLRPGMVHLKHYISVGDQVRIVATCRKLGLSSGGFYQPLYRDGVSKLNLNMMCLGKNWDSLNSQYIDVSPADGAKTLSIPAEFCKWVDQAIRDSHDYLRKQSVRNIEETLPTMNPDICIVNFYSKSGRLGLHQDKDESKESLSRGLPVVSISIGDSAEFVYGDQRDPDKVEKVVLESGDVLIFGGSSRHIFHGVTSINGETAPKVLLEESNLRPGRLNLTFRQF